MGLRFLDSGRKEAFQKENGLGFGGLGRGFFACTLGKMDCAQNW